jgi:hypothetical protein
MASQDIRYSCWYVCESDLSHSLLTTRQRDKQSPTDSACILEMAVGSVRKDVGGQTHHAFMVCHARVWIETSTVQLVSRSNAAVQFFGLIQQLHN